MLEGEGEVDQNIPILQNFDEPYPGQEYSSKKRCGSEKKLEIIS